MSILNKLEAFKVEIEDAYLDLNERATDYKGMLEDTEEQIEAEFKRAMNDRNE